MNSMLKPICKKHWSRSRCSAPRCQCKA
jgi:hypothetical protein